jgi:hypothetical protein
MGISHLPNIPISSRSHHVRHLHSLLRLAHWHLHFAPQHWHRHRPHSTQSTRYSYRHLLCGLLYFALMEKEGGRVGYGRYACRADRSGVGARTTILRLIFHQDLNARATQETNSHSEGHIPRLNRNDREKSNSNGFIVPLPPPSAFTRLRSHFASYPHSELLT